MKLTQLLCHNCKERRFKLLHPKEINFCGLYCRAMFFKANPHLKDPDGNVMRSIYEVFGRPTTSSKCKGKPRQNELFGGMEK